MADNETIADIIARKRRLAAEMEKTLGDQHSSVEMLKDDADRFEAAHKRERGDCAKLREVLLQVIRSMELESGHMCTEKKRLGMHGQTQEDLCKGCRARNAECWTMTLKRECEAALAAPPRNCEVGTSDEQSERFDAFCDAHKYVGDDGANWCSRNCPCYNDTNCGVQWAQMPYESEAAK